MTGFIEELKWRGLYFDATPGLDARFAAGPIKGYVGFDPTAPSLQIGNLVPVMLLAHLQRAGGTPIIVVGGGTGLIGDPSGKRSERPLLDPDVVRDHSARQHEQLAQFLDFDCGDTTAVAVNNADWLTPIALVDFLRDVGKHFTLSQILQKESIKSRLDEGISYAEMSYMLLQAYDFLHLYTELGCELQMGGSDQWGNITAGTELIRRSVGGQAHALCAPLVTTSSGTKFGKTDDGAVWLDADLTSPYQFYQFWINTDDRDVETYLKMFTFKSRTDIGSVMQDHGRDPGKRLAQAALASDLTRRVHGVHLERNVSEASRIIFQEIAPREASLATWQLLARELPSWKASRSSLPRPLPEIIAESGLTKSKGEARRQLQQGGIYVNDTRATGDEDLTEADLIHGHVWLRRGKKTNLIVEFTD